MSNDDIGNVHNVLAIEALRKHLRGLFLEKGDHPGRLTLERSTYVKLFDELVDRGCLMVTGTVDGKRGIIFKGPACDVTIWPGS